MPAIKVGFIGLGSMGRPMAVNLLNAGTTLMIHNRSQQVVRELEDMGGEAAISVEQLASQCDRIFV